MKTELIKIDRENMDLAEMKRAGEILKEGGLVGFPEFATCSKTKLPENMISIILPEVLP